jgi:hypothetical protein
MKFLPNMNKIAAALLAGLIANASLVQAADHVGCQLVAVNQEAKITAPDAATGDLFGFRVAIDGDTMVTSALLDGDGGYESGSAYVYARDGAEWTLQAKLTAPDAAAGDWFGRSASIDGDTIVIGANKTGDLGYWSGSAYVFVRNGTTWTQQAKLTASDGELGDLFATSLEIDGDTVVVGARWDDNDAGDNAGSAYVFERIGTTWIQQAKLTAPAADIITSGEFGGDVTIDNNTIVVAGGTLEGAKSYVYVLNDNEWTLQAQFDGGYPAISADTILIGGNVYVRSGTTWTLQAELTPLGDTADYVGFARALDGDTIVLGALRNDDGEEGSCRHFVFVLNGTTWTQQGEFVSPNIEGAARYADISGDTVVIGSRLDDSAVEQSGSAYVFRISVGSIADYFNCIIDYVSDDSVIFDSDWKNKRMRDGFILKLEAVLEIVLAAQAAEDTELAAALYLQAAEKVDNDLIALTDGLQGIGARTRDDWILVQEAQDILYPDLLFLSDYLWLQVP